MYVLWLRRKGGIVMLELLKSKIIIGFILFILGITYVEAMNVKKMEENTKKACDNYISMNLN